MGEWGVSTVSPRLISCKYSQRAAMQAALTAVLQHSDLVARCDHVASQTGGAQSGLEYMQEDLET